MARPARRPRRQTQVAGLLVGLFQAAPASARRRRAPDKEPPKIVSVKPDSGAVVPTSRRVVIQFDDVIDEMAGSGGRGAPFPAWNARCCSHPCTRCESGLAPHQGDGQTERGLEEARIPARDSAGLRRSAPQPLRLDQDGDLLDGPEIGHARIGGITLKWIEQTILARALIEAVPLPDSAGYLTMADSAASSTSPTCNRGATSCMRRGRERRPAPQPA